MKAFKAIDNTANEIPVPGNTNHHWKKKSKKPRTLEGTKSEGDNNMWKVKMDLFE